MTRRGRPSGTRPEKQARRGTMQEGDGDLGNEGEDEEEEGGVKGGIEQGGELLRKHTALEKIDGKRVWRGQPDGGNGDADRAVLTAAGMDCELDEFETGGSGSSNVMALAAKDEEDRLVEKALGRVRRAQNLGKKNVRLSKREYDALERRRLQEDSDLNRRQSDTMMHPLEQEQGKGQSTAMTKDIIGKTRKRRSEPSNFHEGQGNKSHFPFNGEIHDAWGTATGVSIDHHAALSDARPSSSLSRRPVRPPLSNIPPRSQYPQQQHLPGHYAYVPDLCSPPPWPYQTPPYTPPDGPPRTDPPYLGTLASLPPYTGGQPMFQSYDPTGFRGSLWGQNVASSGDMVPNSSSQVPFPHERRRSSTPNPLYAGRGRRGSLVERHPSNEGQEEDGDGGVLAGRELHPAIGESVRRRGSRQRRDRRM